MKVLPTLRQLRFLVALADRRHFGQAAEACCVGQSTLSAAIQDLEAALGVALFDRTRRSVAPTGIGAEIAERARAILKDAEDLVDVALAAQDPLSGPLRLGVIPTIGPFLLPLMLPLIREAAPGLRLYLREEQTAPLLTRLDAGGWMRPFWRFPFRSTTSRARISRSIRSMSSVRRAIGWRSSRPFGPTTWRPTTCFCSRTAIACASMR